MRDDVRSFGYYMATVLDDNESKGGWNQCTIEYLLQKLDNNMDKVRSGLRIELGEVINLSAGITAQRKTLVDVANYAMMLHSKLEL